MARGWGREGDFDADREEVRPAASPRSAYITAEGYARLRAEYDALWTRRRPAVVKALAAAAAEGDRSENAEYQYRKKELRELDRRVRYLQKRLPELKVVDAKPSDPGRVYFGAWVTLAGDDGQEKTWRIVGPDEVDTSQGMISVDSPLARAVLRRTAGDVVQARLPGGEAEFEIVAVRYAP
jgi:transcription elongation factor GreB